MKRYLTILFLAIFSLIIKAQVTDTTFIQVDGVKIHTVLSNPLKSAACPLVIIIAGSGPTDLNGNQMIMHNNSLKYLSEALVEKSIATVRFDKRAIGKSKINDMNEADLTIEKYADDLVSIIDHYRGRGYQDIYLAGHSEGSLIALIAMQKIKVKGFISIAGAGSPADEILRKQLKPKLPQPLYLRVEGMLDSLKNSFQVKNTLPQLNSLFRQSVQPYLISWFKYDPAGLLSKLNLPVLIIQGDKDIQVDQEEAGKLNAASKNGRLLIIKNMNHIMKTINGDLNENISSYSKPDLPVNQELSDAMVEFIKKSR
jgi:uncharacterized protein